MNAFCRLLPIVSMVILGVAAPAAAVDALPLKGGDFRGRITLVGASTGEDGGGPSVWTISPDGEDVQKLFAFSAGRICAGRVSPDAKQLAYTYAPRGSSDVYELWLLDADGNSQKLADKAGWVTAWSPDGKQIAYYRLSDETGEREGESFVFDLASKTATKLPLAKKYFAEDWGPKNGSRTVIDMNQSESHQIGEDSFPLRQLDLLKTDGKIVPLNEDPAHDNLWARFSPRGDRIAHYRLRFLDQQARNYAVVCDADGSNSKEICGFTDLSNVEQLPLFSPQSFPAWSPDGKTIAWLVYTNTMRDWDGKQLQLMFIPVDGGKPWRISLTEKGFSTVTAIDWR
jgi:Tol biopolymer transport system component